MYTFSGIKIELANVYNLTYIEVLKSCLKQPILAQNKHTHTFSHIKPNLLVN